MASIRERLEAAYDYVRSLLGESSTMRGVAQALTLVGGMWAKWPPDLIALAAVSVGTVIKLLLPDDLPWSKARRDG